MESRWGRNIPHRARPVMGPTQPPIQWVPGFSLGGGGGGGKAARAWRWLPTPSSAEVKERVQLNLCSPFGPTWPVVGWNLPLPLSGWGDAQVKWWYGIIGASPNNFDDLLGGFSFYRRKPRFQIWFIRFFLWRWKIIHASRLYFFCYSRETAFGNILLKWNLIKDSGFPNQEKSS